METLALATLPASDARLAIASNGSFWQLKLGHTATGGGIWHLGSSASSWSSGGGKFIISKTDIPSDAAFTIDQLNNVAIGTTNPQARLHLSGGQLLIENSQPSIFTGTGTTDLSRYLQLLNSPSGAISSGLKAGGVLVADSYSYANPGKNDLIVKGRIGIGTPLTSNPNGYHLAVNGIMGAKDLRIEGSSTTWPDYVFTNNYRLPKLSEVEKYILANRHLEGVPTAAEVKEEGYSASEMDAILLKKVEELTLYIIEQQKQIEELKRQIGN